MVDADQKTPTPTADFNEHRTRISTSAHNEAANLWRQRHRRWERDLAAVAASIVTDTVTDVDVVRAIAGLSLQQRCVVYFTYWHQMTEAEIADTLGIARGTVHRNLHRAQTHLREALT
jgi:RNA polymerase sigma factor (sigma-70 family)